MLARPRMPLAAGAMAVALACLQAGCRGNHDLPRSARGQVSLSKSSTCPVVRGHALDPADYDQCAEPTHAPRMLRWRPLVRRVAGADPDDNALLMTLMFIESGGRQFAVSRSGCAGLMQFCDSTALREPFDAIFAIDRLRPCACRHRRCYIGRDTRRLLETSGPTLHRLASDEFPCELSDARFDPEQALRAGWTYIKSLAASFERNVYLIYIGYNSGPHVAERIWRKLGAKKSRNLRAIGRVLRRELAPTFGRRRARRRARALLDVHLPKIARVYQAYREN